MAIISFTVPDAAMPELVDALCALPPAYSPTLPDGSPNPVTKAQYARQQLIAYMRRMVLTYRRAQAEAAINATPPDIT